MTGVNEGERGEETNECATCSREMNALRCIEVGHTFLLDTKYSDVFKANFATARDIHFADT